MFFTASAAIEYDLVSRSDVLVPCFTQYHAIQVGMDMGIVNAGFLTVYDEIPKDLLQICEDALWNRDPNSTDKLLEYAKLHSKDAKTDVDEEEWRRDSCRIGSLMHSSRES